MKLWNGRFSSNSDLKTDMYNASIGFDIKLLPHDVEASIAHVITLKHAHVLDESEMLTLIDGLEQVRDEYLEGNVEYTLDDEDVHMLLERLLTEKVGEVGKKVHTGRSRNDQVAVATRLYTIHELRKLRALLKAWIEVLNGQSEKYLGDVMAGCTHLQAAQPITLGFWFDSYKQMFKRDLRKLTNALEVMDECPLGSAALAGTSYPINRSITSEILEFAKPTDNSMDSVADRDYILDTLYICASIGTHLSKMAEEIILFNSQVYNYIKLDDLYSTGSSIMPQKKNPDIAELARGKSARLIGNLTQMLTLIKGTPLAYNKDFQEDKESLFDSLENLQLTLEVFAPMVETATFNTDKMRSDCELGYINATDLADYLVGKDIPFRTAHHITGTLVKYAEDNGIRLDDISLDVMKQENGKIDDDIYDFINIDACLNRRMSHGAPGWFIALKKEQINNRN